MVVRQGVSNPYHAGEEDDDDSWGDWGDRGGTGPVLCGDQSMGVSDDFGAGAPPDDSMADDALTGRSDLTIGGLCL